LISNLNIASPSQDTQMYTKIIKLNHLWYFDDIESHKTIIWKYIFNLLFHRYIFCKVGRYNVIISVLTLRSLIMLSSFGIWYKVRLHSFTCGHSAVQALFVEKAILPLLKCVGIRVQNQLFIHYGSISGLAILCYPYIFVLMPGPHFLIIIALQ
jgi:hypothetical protein